MYRQEPSIGLLEKIINRIGDIQRRTVRRKFIFFSIMLLASAGALIPLFTIVRTGLSDSGFLEFLSLIFSDSGIVAGYWQNFTLALLETVPIMSIAAFLIAIAVLCESLTYLFKHKKILTYGI